MKKEKSDKNEFNDIHKLKEKRKWKKIAHDLNDKELEQEDEEEENFIKNIKKGSNKFEKKLTNKYDEFGTEFTPFNMTEEMEEGDIDNQGHFVHRKNKD